MRELLTEKLEFRGNIKPQYLGKNNKQAIFIDIYEDKRYGAVAKIIEEDNFFIRIEKCMPKKQRKRIAEKLDKAMKSPKPVDTSNWVRPDEESIRIELVLNLFLLEILKEDCYAWTEARYEAGAYYWILHNKSPKNPQPFIGYVLEPFIDNIIREMKGTEIKKLRNIMSFTIKGKIDVKKYRREYQNWRKNALKNMILLK